jgi:phospholipase C
METLYRKIGLALATSALVGSVGVSAPAAYASDHDTYHSHTATPIKHVILILGENRTFDNVFATFKPHSGQHVWNLLSEGIVNADGSPGPNFNRAQQWIATDTGTYSLHPDKVSPYNVLGAITTSGTPNAPYFPSISVAEAIEPALPSTAYPLLVQGGSGLPAGSKIDTRFPADFANGPFPITDSIGYDDYAGSPVHRFFQMWQQVDCDVALATTRNPSGCQNDLWSWVEASVGAGSNGAAQPADYDQPGNHEGAVAMGFYNVQKGDVSYFNTLAQTYALSDNYHQAVMGGTGSNHLAIGYGTDVYYADANGNPAVPPQNQIENPDAQPGTDNFYIQDGYSGGSYVNCSDRSQPGVAAVRDYLSSLPYASFRNGDCQPGAYYIVNNYNPGYLGTGQPAPLGPAEFTVPPTTQQNLGLLLSRYNVSWHYYGEGWNNGLETGEADTYCNICNPFLYSKQIMTNPALRANLKDIGDLYNDIQNDSLPAVSIVKPDAILDGHPASSKFDLFEAFCKKIVDQIQTNPALWKDTAIMITVDEGGGYYDSGYIQPVDFFGDGPRIPMIVVSPYSRGVGMVHNYGDHVSFDKFVEANWELPTISRWSRDNLPDPIASRHNPYVPLNSPAIGDLMGMFDFGDHDRGHDDDRGSHRHRR